MSTPISGAASLMARIARQIRLSGFSASLASSLRRSGRVCGNSATAGMPSAAASLAALAAPLAGETWPRQWSSLSIASLGFQTVIVTFASYLTWFWLVRHYPATRLSAFTLITPVAGLAAGVALLGEPLQPNLCDLLEPLLAEMIAIHGGTMEGQAYSASKRAIIRKCERHALDWGQRGARLVSVSPGVVWTPMGQEEAANGHRAQAMADATPMGRWGTADDVAATVEFLASGAASYITGCDIRVDGGAVAAMRGTNF